MAPPKSSKRTESGAKQMARSSEDSGCGHKKRNRLRSVRDLCGRRVDLDRCDADLSRSLGGIHLTIADNFPVLSLEDKIGLTCCGNLMLEVFGIGAVDLYRFDARERGLLFFVNLAGENHLVILRLKVEHEFIVGSWDNLVGHILFTFGCNVIRGIHHTLLLATLI